MTCRDWPGWEVDTQTVRCTPPPIAGKSAPGEGQAGAEVLKWERFCEVEDRSEDSEAGT